MIRTVAAELAVEPRGAKLVAVEPMAAERFSYYWPRRRRYVRRA